jgi:hypothetical protein
VDGPTDKQSWYLGLEIDGGVTRVWGFPGESAQMNASKVKGTADAAWCWWGKRSS